MNTVSRKTLARAVQARLPRETVDRLRLLTLGLALASVLVVAAAILLTIDVSLRHRGLALVLLVVLTWRWVGWYRAGRAHRADLLLESAAVIAVVSLFQNPASAIWFVYGGIYYRPLVASNRETIFSTTVYVASYCAGIAIGAGDVGAAFAPSTLVQLAPMMLIAAIVRTIDSTLARNARITSELRRIGSSYRTLIEQLPGAVLISDENARIHYISPRIQDILGYHPDMLIGPVERWLGLIHPDDRDYVSTIASNALATGESLEFECRATRHDGSVAWIRVESLLVDGDTAMTERWRGIITDITVQRQLAMQLEYQAFHDALTDLPNRSRFEERLADRLADQASNEALHAVLFLDLDQFKVVNDNLGHYAGDQLPVDASARILECVRDGDTVARVGGDEFAILLENLQDKNEAIGVSESIARELTNPFRLQGHLVHISTSIGIAFTDAPNDGPDDMVRQADVAMYAAKRAGNGRHAVYEPEMDRQAWERMRLETDLHDAVERQEFAIYYQPVVDLSTGTVREIEALVRWQHPSRGLLLPADFLPLAEEIGLMSAIDRWVLQQACRQAREWQRQFAGHADLTVCVNMSPCLLREPSLANYVSSVLESTGLAPENLKLEVTEHAMITDIELGYHSISDLHAIGVHIAIDDFGAGNSSLSYLRRLPVDTLKIDRSYVAEIDGTPHSMQMIAAVITLAKSLGLMVTAEGIEHRHQTRLQSIGCDLGQGYYFDRPLPAAELERVLTNVDIYSEHLDIPDRNTRDMFVGQPDTGHHASVSEDDPLPTGRSTTTQRIACK